MPLRIVNQSTHNATVVWCKRAHTYDPLATLFFHRRAGSEGNSTRNRPGEARTAEEGEELCQYANWLSQSGEHARWYEVASCKHPLLSRGG